MRVIYPASHMGTWCTRLKALIVHIIDREVLLSLGNLPSYLHRWSQVWLWWGSFVSGSGRARGSPLSRVRISRPFRHIRLSPHLVYIFKHSTVTGVFIAMFIKYVSFPSRRISLQLLQWLCLLFDTLLPSPIFPSRSRLRLTSCW